jgi:hypothetical protein
MSNRMFTKRILLSIFFFQLRCCWIPCIDPGCKTAEHGGDIGETVFKQDGRRTGAQFFAWSGAVGDDPRIWVEFTKTRSQIVDWDVDRACNMLPCKGFG